MRMIDLMNGLSLVEDGHILCYLDLFCQRKNWANVRRTMIIVMGMCACILLVLGVCFWNIKHSFRNSEGDLRDGDYRRYVNYQEFENISNNTFLTDIDIENYRVVTTEAWFHKGHVDDMEYCQIVTMRMTNNTDSDIFFNLTYYFNDNSTEEELYVGKAELLKAYGELPPEIIQINGTTVICGYFNAVHDIYDCSFKVNDAVCCVTLYGTKDKEELVRVLRSLLGNDE